MRYGAMVWLNAEKGTGGGTAEMMAFCTRKFIRWAEVNYGYDMRLD